MLCERDYMKQPPKPLPPTSPRRPFTAIFTFPRVLLILAALELAFVLSRLFR